MDMSRTPQEVQEDWERVLLSPGMTVLFLWVKKQLKHAQSDLDAWSTDSYDKVCRSRGNLEAMRKLAAFLDDQTKRAAGDGHTPIEKEK